MVSSLKRVLTALVVLAATVVGAPSASAHPAPGRVTGDIRVHDPSFVKRADGSHLVAHAGDGIALKTSADRSAFRDAGAAFHNGASLLGVNPLRLDSADGPYLY